MEASRARGFLLCCSLALLLLPFATCYAATEAIHDNTTRVFSWRVPLTRVSGPESLAFDRLGGGPYTGVSDGRVLKWHGQGVGWSTFAYNSRYKSIWECRNRPSLETESMCGRPLGLQFHKKSGYLYIADAYLGLMRVGPRGGLAKVVATDAGGLPFKFLNGLDIDQETGEVYFTDSSTTYTRRDNRQVVLSRDHSGRVLKFDPRTNRVTVLSSGLYYPNGIAISPDRSHLLVALTSPCWVVRYWLQGPKRGESELFADLPGYPDNVKRDGMGGFWIALNREKVPENGTNLDVAPNHRPVFGVRLSGEGEVLDVLNKLNRTDATVSEVLQRRGRMWLGSVEVPYVEVFKTSH